MNPQIKADWLAELASGNWTCGTGWLAERKFQVPADVPAGITTNDIVDTPIAYSALGVLCETARKDGVEVPPYRWELTKWHKGYLIATYGGEGLALPPSVAQWAEMDALPWMKLDYPNGIFNLAYITKIGGFALASTAIKNHL